MGTLFSTSAQSSESIFLIGKLNGKLPNEIQFYSLSQAYLDQPNGNGDNSEQFENKTTEIGCFQSDVHNLFLPLPRKKKLFCLQTYTQWRSSLDLEFLKQFFISPKRTIYLIKINEFPEFVNNFRINVNSQACTIFQFIQEFLKIFYMGMDIRWMEDIHLKNTDWNIRERCHIKTEQLQYLVTDFFKPLGSIKPYDGYCIMGLSWTDLYPAEEYNFALGEAACRYRSGVFSFGRFSPSTFDPTNPKDITEITSDILWKLLKVSSHEIGHLFGLEHCEFFRCHMNESLSITEAMNQPLFYCPVCLRKIQHVCQFSIPDRYEKLEHFIYEVNEQFPSEKWTESLLWLNKCRMFLCNKDCG